VDGCAQKFGTNLLGSVFYPSQVQNNGMKIPSTERGKNNV